MHFNPPFVQLRSVICLALIYALFIPLTLYAQSNCSPVSVSRGTIEVCEPAGYDPDATAPLILLLNPPGFTARDTELLLGLAPFASAGGYLYALVDNFNPSTIWQAHVANGPDSQYVSEVLFQIGDGYRIDPARVYVVGLSNAGFMGYRVACDLDDVIAGVVSFGGAMFDAGVPCGATNPVAVMEIHGREDPLVLYENGGTTIALDPFAIVNYLGSVATVDFWADLADGIATSPLTVAAPLIISEEDIGLFRILKRNKKKSRFACQVNSGQPNVFGRIKGKRIKPGKTRFVPLDSRIIQRLTSAVRKARKRGRDFRPLKRRLRRARRSFSTCTVDLEEFRPRGDDDDDDDNNNTCDVETGPIDLELSLAGAETTRTYFGDGCGNAVLLTVEGGEWHVPILFTNAARFEIMEFVERNVKDTSR